MERRAMSSLERQQQEKRLKQFQDILDQAERGQMDQAPYRDAIIGNATIGIFTLLQQLGSLPPPPHDTGESVH
jgi:hypothetical protein